MCGPKAPKDNSAQVAQIQVDAAERERQAAEQERLRKEEAFKANLNNSYSTAIADARRYFAEQGLDPAQFENAIINEANSKRATVPVGDLSPGTYFNNFGQTVYDNQTAARRAKALRDIGSFSRDGFANDLIKDTSDDAFINSILEEQYADATRRIQGQKLRGTLNDYGLEQALKDLDIQKSGARSNLDAIGGGVLTQGRTKIGNIASSGKSAAGSIGLADEFDPFKYQRDINDEVANFFAGLGDKVKGAAPKDLFDLSAAFQRGGAKQGVGNFGYDPSASAGIFDFFAAEEEAKKKKTPSLSPF